MHLPAAFTSFVGRQREIATVGGLLGTARLLTLTGTGGVGKTRLALEVAAGSVDAFPDGVWLVDLAPIRGPEAVAGAVVAALRVPEVGAQPALELLRGFLAGRRALIVLDNCEHLAAGCAELAQVLLSAAAGLRILATSRKTLGMTGEHVFTVPSLSSHDAVELLLDRATAVRPELRSGEVDRGRISRLCADLDGLPLAIELAASRLRTLTLAQVADRLKDRFALLTGGGPTTLPHQRTLRGMIDWSYELCTPAQRLLWNRLSVFAGGFSLETAEGVCAGDGIAEHEVLDLLDRLVAQSVVLTTEAEDLPYYRLLESIRQYGRERLAESGEENRLLRRHRDYFLALAECINARWFGPGQVKALARLRADHSNLLAALDCDADPQARFALATALRLHWCADGFLGEGRRQFDRALAVAPEPTPARARALVAAAWVAFSQGDPAVADRWLDEAGAMGEQLGDPMVLAYVKGFRGVSARVRGRLAEAIARYEDAKDILTALGDDRGAADWLLALACCQAYAGDPRTAETSGQFIAAAEANGERWGRAQVLQALGSSAWERGEVAEARSLVRAALENMRGFNDYSAVARMLEVLAWTTASADDHEQAARLLGAADALWRDIGITITAFDPWMAEHHARCEAAVTGVLSPASYAKAFAEGGLHGGPGRAVEYALSPDPAASAVQSPLTRREREVAELVAKGMTNRQIATELVLSPRTVDRHIDNIRAKLHFGRRTQIAAWWATSGSPIS